MVKKITIVSASLLLSIALFSNPISAGWHTHYHYAKTICRGGVCHKWVRNITHRCSKGGCRTYRTHYHWRWRE